MRPKCAIRTVLLRLVNDFAAHANGHANIYAICAGRRSRTAHASDEQTASVSRDTPILSATPDARQIFVMQLDHQASHIMMADF